MRDFVAAHPRVMMAWMTTGEFDYVIVGAFAGQKAFVDFLEKDLQSLIALDRYETFVAVDELKFEPGQPV